MKKQEIKKQIDDAVRIFRESLEKSYLEKDIPFYGISINRYTSIFTGKININRKTNGNLRISGELPKTIFKDECKYLPRNANDYKVYPIVIGMFQVDPKEFDDKK